MSEWYWCMEHSTVEGADTDCPPDRRMGPYPSREAAANWQDQARQRTEQWDAEGEAWEEGEE